MKYFQKQSSIIIIVSIMLCLINITYQYKSNFNLSLKSTAITELKTEMKSVAKAISAAVAKLKAEAKANTAAATEMKTEAKAKEETVNAANAKSWMKALIKSNTDTDMKSLVALKRKLSVPRGFVNIKGRGNFCIRARNRGRIYQGKCNGNAAKWKFIKMRANKKKCYFAYCNKYKDLKKAFCSGRTCTSNSHYNKCKNHWFKYGKKEKRRPDPQSCSTNGNYVVKNIKGQVLDVHFAKTNNGAKIYSDKRNNGGNQKWYFLNIGGGKFMLKNLKSNRCLDNTGKARAGVGYHQWSCSSKNKNQHFRYTKIGGGRKSGKKAKGKRGVFLVKFNPKRVSESSPYENNKYPATNALGNNKKFSHTNKGKGMWWKAQFGKQYNFRRIRIRNRIDCRVCGQRLARTKVFISGKLCGSLPNKTVQGKWYEVRCNLKGNEIKLVTVKNTYLHISGIQAYAEKASGKKAKGRSGKKAKGKSGKKAKGNSGKKMKYRKKKTLKFLNGKYSFNLKTGRKFCSSKCSNNKSSNNGICFKRGMKKCKPCAFKGNKKSTKGKQNQELCKIVCRSIDNQKCDFYAYTDDKKKVINKRLLNRFGRIFVTKFLQMNR